jgi:hypothetical protein
MKTNAPTEPLRPRDIALLMLSSGDLLPRQRARDQQADLAGLQLKRRVLDRLAALDPDPNDIETALVQIIEEIGPPHGPTRAVAANVRDDWRAACAAPDWVAQLLADAANQSTSENEGRRRGRRVPE